MVCKHFGTCGGCCYQDMPYEQQLVTKQNQVVSVLAQLPVTYQYEMLPIIPSPKQFFYRNKMEYIISRENEQVLIGLRKKNRHYEVVNVEECLLQSENSNKIIDIVRNFTQQNNVSVYDKRDAQGLLRYLIIRDGKHTNQTMVTIVTQNDNFPQIDRLIDELSTSISSLASIVWSINPEKGDTAFSQNWKVVNGKNYFEECIGQTKLLVSPYAFLQTNIYQTENLYDIISCWIMKDNQLLLDLYCGIGGISLFCASKSKQVIGIEILDTATEDAKTNMQLNNINNCEFVCGDVPEELNKMLSRLISSENSPVTVVLDPPRAGIAKKVAYNIISLRPERIIYVCCNINTLAANLQTFLQFYKIIRVQALDMFPQTMHMETVVMLERI